MPKPPKSRPRNFETLAVHAGHQGDPTTKSRAVPIYQTTSYLFDSVDHAAKLFSLEESGNIYSRLDNPTTNVLAQRIAKLEGGTFAVPTASGQAAEALAILAICETGDEIVSSSTLYGGTYTLFHFSLAKLGIRTVFVDASDPENFRRAITPKTKVLYGESVGNPRLDTFPLEDVAAIGQDHGIPLMIDNTFPTPFLMNPLKHGANIVVHSSTKFIGGHGTSIGGLIVDGGNFDWSSGRFPGFTTPDPSYHGLVFWDMFQSFKKMGNIALGVKAQLQCMRDFGPAPSPFNSFLMLQGLETLHVRMERHSENAATIARWLERHPKVAWVRYPGLEGDPSKERAWKYHSRGQFGAILTFGLKGGYEAAVRVINGVKLFSHLANVGDVKSLIIHPASTTHSQLSDTELAASGVTSDLIRLSVGIEHIDDLIDDLKFAIET